MNQRAFVVKELGEVIKSKEIFLADNPQSLRPVVNPLGWQILLALSKQPKYPAQVARDLKVYRQKIYYYIRLLKKEGLISVVEEKSVEGGAAKFYKPSYAAIGMELPFGEETSLRPRRLDSAVRDFLHPFVEDSRLCSKIVVGSPEPHGPNRATARDGHYAAHLGIFLGGICQVPKDFAVKLDVDVKTEKEEKNNLILVGGPGTNLLTADVNPYLPIRFDERNYWAGLRDRGGGVYNTDRDGVVAKIKNPFDPTKRIIVLAGIRHIGTKSAVLALTNFSQIVLKGYKGEDEWAVAIRGFDLDGDGKVDSVELAS